MKFDGLEDHEAAGYCEEIAAFADEAPNYKTRRVLERLNDKIGKGRRVGFNPLLILGIISLVVQLIRLWKEWQKKENE